MRFIIRGKVQGVWFRESTRREAETLGLSGYAANLEDGSVEVVAAGGDAELDKLAAWLRHGPTLARVEQLSSEEIGDPGKSGFFTR
jgi:acylphosphatase